MTDVDTRLAQAERKLHDRFDLAFSTEVAIAVVIAGIVANFAIRTGPASLIGATLGLALVALVWRAINSPSPNAAGLLAIAAGFSLALPMRSSLWLEALSTLMGLACVTGAALLGRAVRVPLGLGTVVAWIVRSFSALIGPLTLLRTLVPAPSSRYRLGPVIRGLH